MIKKILLLLTLGLVLWSCNDRDDEDYYYDMIVGRWEFRQANAFEIIADPIDVIPYIERDASKLWYGDWEFFDDGVAIEYRNGSTRYTYFFDRDYLVITDFYTGAELFDVRVDVGNRNLSMFFDETYKFRNAYSGAYVEEVIVEAYYRRR